MKRQVSRLIVSKEGRQRRRVRSEQRRCGRAERPCGLLAGLGDTSKCFISSEHVTVGA